MDILIRKATENDTFIVGEIAEIGYKVKTMSSLTKT
jgi:hypothetical protein